MAWQGNDKKIAEIIAMEIAWLRDELIKHGWIPPTRVIAPMPMVWGGSDAPTGWPFEVWPISSR